MPIAGVLPLEFLMTYQCKMQILFEKILANTMKTTILDLEIKFNIQQYPLKTFKCPDGKRQVELWISCFKLENDSYITLMFLPMALIDQRKYIQPKSINSCISGSKRVLFSAQNHRDCHSFQ